MYGGQPEIQDAERISAGQRQRVDGSDGGLSGDDLPDPSLRSDRKPDGAECRAFQLFRNGAEPVRDGFGEYEKYGIVRITPESFSGLFQNAVLISRGRFEEHVSTHMDNTGQITGAPERAVLLFRAGKSSGYRSPGRF